MIVGGKINLKTKRLYYFVIKKKSQVKEQRMHTRVYPLQFAIVNWEHKKISPQDYFPTLH